MTRNDTSRNLYPMGIVRWVFSKKDSSVPEAIEVNDVASARLLAQFLQHYEKDQWQMGEQLVDESVAELAGRPDQAAEEIKAPDPEPVVVEAVAPAPDPVMVESVASKEAENLEQHENNSEPPSIFTTERKNGKRRYMRYKNEFRVILVTGGKAFRTFSSDISVGGMLLKQKIPAGMGNEICTVFIGSTANRENIELRCRILPDASNLRRISFVEGDVISLRKLEDWILRAKHASPAYSQVA